jgi:hypothetical protein
LLLLPSLVQWLFGHLLFHILLSERLQGDQLLAPPHFSGALSAPCPFCCVSFSVPCLLYSLFFVFFFLQSRGQSVQGAILVYPRSICGNTVCCCWYVFPKQVWSWCLAVQEPSTFLSVMWGGEALYGLGAWGVRIFLLFGGFFLPSVAPASQQDF